MKNKIKKKKKMSKFIHKVKVKKTLRSHIKIFVFSFLKTKKSVVEREKTKKENLGKIFFLFFLFLYGFLIYFVLVKKLFGFIGLFFLVLFVFLC